MAGLAAGAVGTVVGGLFDGRLAPAKVFEYQGATYALWAAQYKNSATVKIAQKVNGSWKLVDELTDQDFLNTVTPGQDGLSAKAHINALITAAKALSNAAKAQPQPGAANPLPGLQQKKTDVVTAENRVLADILANACKALQVGCFAAGTRLWTPSGYRPVEEIEAGEWVYARSEFDPNGEIEAKRVEAKFERTGYILHVHLVGGGLIRTTPEHPFYERERGWVPAGELHAGDFVRTDGGWVQVEELFDTGEWEKVYNLRVADHHTYFVGEEDWGFCVWAHNVSCQEVQTAVGHQNYPALTSSQATELAGLATAQDGPHLYARLAELYPNGTARGWSEITQELLAIAGCTASSVSTAQTEIDAYRSSHGHPASGSGNDAGTVAQLRVGGSVYYGSNTQLSSHEISIDRLQALFVQLTGLPLTSRTARSIYHAEVEAMVKAHDALGTLPTLSHPQFPITWSVA